MKHRSTLLTLLAYLEIIGLSSCTHYPSESAIPTPTQEDPTPVATIEQSTEEKLQIKEYAATFDRFVKRQLTAKEQDDLTSSCKKPENNNPFCNLVNNRDKYETQLQSQYKAPTQRHFGAVRPRIVRGKIANWLELRLSSVTALLRGLTNLTPQEIDKLVKLSIKETQCPNNIAIALAAHKEDELPSSGVAKTIASLYEKGGSCLIKSPPDREALLTRGALFYYLTKDYKKAAKLLEISSSIPEAYTGRALYWLYRTKTAMNENESAKNIYDQMKVKYPFSFHTLVARTANDEDPGEILSNSLNKTLTRSQLESSVNSLVEAVEILTELKYQDTAAKVLEWAVAESHEAEPEFRIYLAELTTDQKDYRSRITLLSDLLYKNPSLISKKTMELYFPKAYFPIFEKNQSKLDPYLLLAVARQESAFNPRAVSSANARGLLQLHPKTGIRYQGHPKPDLMNPEVNINIASRYLQDLLKRVNGQIYLALAAYNAGENRLPVWTSRYQDAEPILFIDLLPYRETREYVASVLRNYYWYRRIHQSDGNTEPSSAIFFSLP